MDRSSNGRGSSGRRSPSSGATCRWTARWIRSPSSSRDSGRAATRSGPAQDRHDYRQGFFTFYDALWERINLRNDKQDFQDGFFVTPIATFKKAPAMFKSGPSGALNKRGRTDPVNDPDLLMADLNPFHQRPDNLPPLVPVGLL